MKQIKTAFTLVELIVVITILSVLSTVAFISFQWYTNDARDATKISDLINIWRNIWNASTAGKQFRINNLQDITYKVHPWTVNVKIWELTQWVVPGLWETPLDPFTWKPYIVWLYTNSDNTANFGQIWGILENRYGEVNMLGSEAKIPANVPVQRVVWNYRANDIYGISGLIPRWAIEDFEWFKNTWFYQSWTLIYGITIWSNPNNYIFAMDRNPVQQIVWYTDEKTLIYESFENIAVKNSGEPGNPDKYPRCISQSASVKLGFENDSTRVDYLQTLDCSIDRNQGVSSSSSLYLNWLRQGAWDGQYSYITLDNQKKYEMIYDVKGTMDTDLVLNFYCKAINQNGGTVNSAGKNLSITLDPNNFTRIHAYVNESDSYGNDLSLDISWYVDPSIVSYTCIFYRTWDPKAGEELYFDNYIVREID